MRRDCLKLRLSDPNPGSLSFHASDSDDESSDRGSRGSRSGEDSLLPLDRLPAAVLAAMAQVSKLLSELSNSIENQSLI